jgi:hypothetical protein
MVTDQDAGVGVPTVYGVRTGSPHRFKISFALLTIAADNTERARLVNQVESLSVSQVGAEVYHVPLAAVVGALQVLVIRLIAIRLLVIQVLTKSDQIGYHAAPRK